MRRQERHELIRQLIAEQVIPTQEDLKGVLEARGVQVTQATLSRDIRELGLLKVTDSQGKRQYALPDELPRAFSAAASQLILSVARAEFILVFKTELGNADVLANIIDGEKKTDILGTVAGADTLLVICKDTETAAVYEAALS